MTTKRVFVSDHSLGALAVCEVKHHLAWRRYEPKDAAVALECGRAIHSALEQWRRGFDAGAALGVFAHAYNEYSVANVPSDDARDYRNVEKILAEYMTRRTTHPWDEVVSIEMGYAAPLYLDGTTDTEYWYYCRPDMVVRRDGRLWSVDTKSTGWLKPDWNNQWDVAPQITGQQWVLERVFGEQCRDSFIDGIELKTANSSSKKCTKHGVPYHECATEHMNFKFHMTHREEFQHLDWSAETHKLVGRMIVSHQDVAKYGLRAAGVQGVYTGACVAYGRFCDYYSYCSTGRQEGSEVGLFAVSDFDLSKQGKVLGPGMVEVDVPVREAA